MIIMICYYYFRRERMRKMEMSSAGQKSLRSRVQNKKARTTEQELGHQRHMQAMKELEIRRLEKSKRSNGKTSRVVLAKKGIGSGVKSNNKYMTEFNNMKKGFEKRKGNNNNIIKVKNKK